MSKPLNAYGGWLRFFYITNWIQIVSLVYVVLVLSPGLFGRPLNAVYWFTFVIDSGLRVFFVYKTIKAIKNQEGSVPNRIVRLLACVLLIPCLVAIPKIYCARLVAGVPGVRAAVITVINVAIWFCIWVAYFRKSKRVFAYYGKNADKFF
jgi:hypothetical protein